MKNEPPVEEMKKRAMELMQHNIYLTQYRLQNLKVVTDKYAKDLRFDVLLYSEYLFCQMRKQKSKTT
jgi:hypothetical protein